VIKSVSIRIYIRFPWELRTSINLMHIALTSSEALLAHKCNNISSPFAFMNLCANSTGLAQPWSDLLSSSKTLISLSIYIWKHGQDLSVKLWAKWSISDKISLPPDVSTHSKTPAIGSRCLSTCIFIELLVCVVAVAVGDAGTVSMAESVLISSGPLKSSWVFL